MNQFFFCTLYFAAQHPVLYLTCYKSTEDSLKNNYVMMAGYLSETDNHYRFSSLYIIFMIYVHLYITYLSNYHSLEYQLTFKLKIFVIVLEKNITI